MKTKISILSSNQLLLCIFLILFKRQSKWVPFFFLYSKLWAINKFSESGTPLGWKWPPEVSSQAFCSEQFNTGHKPCSLRFCSFSSGRPPTWWLHYILTVISFSETVIWENIYSTWLADVLELSLFLYPQYDSRVSQNIPAWSWFCESRNNTHWSWTRIIDQTLTVSLRLEVYISTNAQGKWDEENWKLFRLWDSIKFLARFRVSKTLPAGV